MPRTIEKKVTALAASAAGLVASLTPGGATPLTLLATDLSANPRRILFTFAANESAKTLTIVGVDRYNNPVTEIIVPPAGAGALSSTWEYNTLTSITPSGAFAGALTVGWDNTFYSQWFPMDEYRTPFNVGFGVILSAAAALNYTVQHCRQQLIRSAGALGHNDVNLMVFDHPSVAGKTTAQEGNYSFPVSAVRLKINSANNADWAMIRISQAWD